MKYERLKITYELEKTLLKKATKTFKQIGNDETLIQQEIILLH